MSRFALAVQAVFVGYFVLAHLVALVAMLRAVPALRRQRALGDTSALPPVHPAFEPPFSVVVALRDVEATAVQRVSALLAFDYPEYEVVVVNDGSTDGTLQALQAAFGLEAFPEAHWRRLAAQPVRAIFHARADARLRVVDKEPGGEADALNSAVNASRFPLLALMDRDTRADSDALHRLAEPFVEEPATAAACAPARLEAGAGLPARMASLQRLRDLVKNVGWASWRMVLDVPRGLVALRKDTVVQVRGFDKRATDPLLDLLVRVQAVRRNEAGDAPVVRWLADPACSRPAAADDAPRRLAEAQSALVHVLRRHGPLAILAWPHAALVEAVGPWVEIAAALAIVAMWATGLMATSAVVGFVAMMLALAFLVSVTALVLEDSFLVPPRHPRAFWGRVATAAIEVMGPRQRDVAFRALGVLRGLRAR